MGIQVQRRYGARALEALSSCLTAQSITEGQFGPEFAKYWYYYWYGYIFEEPPMWDLVLNPTDTAYQHSFHFWNTYVESMKCRKLFVTVSGFLGLGPNTLASGDIIVALCGAHVPYVLRKTSEGKLAGMFELEKYWATRMSRR
jgi:hypothetical protein